MQIRQFVSRGAFAGAAMFFAVPALAADAAAAPAAAGPTDPQIAMIVVTANQVDIDAAKWAKAHSKNKDVKEFASTMITDHSAVNKDAKALVKKLKVKPEASPD
jgi:putative membrane protein